MGQGLNCPAEVTLHGVYKRDRDSGEPLRDAASVDAYVKRLKKLAAKQASRFLDYEPQRGTWRFEVDHFSRCEIPPARLSRAEQQGLTQRSKRGHLREALEKAGSQAGLLPPGLQAAAGHLALGGGPLQQVCASQVCCRGCDKYTSWGLCC